MVFPAVAMAATKHSAMHHYRTALSTGGLRVTPPYGKSEQEIVSPLTHGGLVHSKNDFIDAWRLKSCHAKLSKFGCGHCGRGSRLRDVPVFTAEQWR
jgi:hypothetical protein